MPPLQTVQKNSIWGIPPVLENCGIDSKKYTGFAFGPGVDRLAMVVNKIPDLRMMFENDTKFLEQLK